MSDTDDEGAFDREAEKEKLREQLRREEEERRSTQHMSELLLKGATMTNKHCDTCGDPIFRYDGQEFCPTCSQVGEAGVGGAPAEEEEEEAPASGGQRSVEAAGQTGTIDRVDTGPATETGAATPSDTRAPTATTPQRTTAGDAGDDVAAARSALARKLSTLAAQAEATDDVGRSRELLAAAREAAEALAAIETIRG